MPGGRPGSNDGGNPEIEDLTRRAILTTPHSFDDDVVAFYARKTGEEPPSQGRRSPGRRDPG